MKSLLYIACLTLFGSCASSQKLTKEETQVTKKMKGQIGTNESESALFSIRSAEISGNTLMVVVNYSGGCGEHTFTCVGSAMISKSLPPRRAIQLVHNNHGDNCRQLITDTLYIDVTEFAYKKEAGSQVILDLSDWVNAINYTYTKE